MKELSLPDLYCQFFADQVKKVIAEESKKIPKRRKVTPSEYIDNVLLSPVGAQPVLTLAEIKKAVQKLKKHKQKKKKK